MGAVAATGAAATSTAVTPTTKTHEGTRRPNSTFHRRARLRSHLLHLAFSTLLPSKQSASDSRARRMYSDTCPPSVSKKRHTASECRSEWPLHRSSRQTQIAPPPPCEEDNVPRISPDMKGVPPAASILQYRTTTSNYPALVRGELLAICQKGHKGVTPSRGQDCEREGVIDFVQEGPLQVGKAPEGLANDNR